jgi:uncharacterized protein (DUF849 family)
MTAEAVDVYRSSPVPVLPVETTPASIRDALIDEERVEFLQAYREAMSEASRSFDLTPVLDVLRNYHRIAVMTKQEGPETHRRLLAKAAEIARTGKNSDARSEEEMMDLINKGLGR